MNEFFTWELLATYSGACVATGILVEFLKGLLPGLPPRLLSYLTAAAILLTASSLPAHSPCPAVCSACSMPCWFPWQPAAGMSSANPLWQGADLFFLPMTV